ncbi:hypothetical protein CCY99_08290 [Helicobacter sp. 16-1353]|uniref:chemotaxis protein CheX n=1 Tax=Helicobacter sp. 16-1353 TaxID=2004996 RepID=UPI000DCDCBB1|nr:chemotaxis protein CheX [Helicobacter sp. 16-1353]RAX51789.1 hypothetical protein CCY99_08290 [Helicobacter sp. 16-1353]
MEILQLALLNTLKETLNISMIEEKKPLSRSMSSRINLDSKIFVIVANKPLLRLFAKDFLHETNPNEEILIDISKEITNLIIGKAKVLYANNGKTLKLGIPEFLGNKAISNYNKAIHYKYKDIRCSIYEVNLEA